MGDLKLGCRAIDLTGKVYGRLTVLEYTGLDKRSRTTWLCKCSCGEELVMSSNALRTGNTSSCGCLHIDTAKELATLHGMRYHPAYIIWSCIKGRTNNKNRDCWDGYGGRGIKMCQDWEDSFMAFWTDMGPTWQEGLTLDRIDNNKGYYNENCRWTTKTVQSHNKRKPSNCTSKYIGVWLDAKSLKYITQICINGKREHLGCFENELAAAITYDDRSEELYGDRPNKTVKGGNENKD